MTVQQKMEDNEHERVSRFSHLLQPIRDLAENWSIDIAQELEEYLDELEHVTISFDDGKTNVNFAEAALLIQSSACIYSKKVEYLYNLVFQTLDYLAEKRKTVRKENNPNVSAADDERPVPDEPDFLTLDDVMEEDTNTRIVEKSRDIERPSRNKSHRLPIALISMTDERRDPSNPNEGLKITWCDMNREGALILEGQEYQNSDVRLSHEPHRKTPASPANGTLVIPDVLDGNHTHIVPGPSADTGDIGVEGNYGDGALSPDSPSGVYSFSVEEPFENTIDSQTRNSISTVSNMSKINPRSKKNAHASDPWAPLDPYQQLVHLVKPFKKGKTYQIPTLNELNDFDDEKPKFSLRRNIFPEFHYLYKREVKRTSIIMKSTSAKSENSAGHRSIRNLSNIIPFGNTVYDSTDTEFSVGNGDIGGGDLSPVEISPPETPQHTSYEEIYQKLIDEYAKMAQDFVVDTALSRRVTEWQERLQPILEEQESRKPFDIHSYGGKVVTYLDGERSKESRDKVVPFSQLVGVTAECNYDICRFFLATLQLANDGNVEILKGGPDGLSVKLISATRRDITAQRTTTATSSEN